MSEWLSREFQVRVVQVLRNPAGVVAGVKRMNWRFQSRWFLDQNKLTYIGGILEMSNNRLYKFWNDLEEGLKTGLPQNESKHGDKPLFEAIYSNEERLREFLHAMGGVQAGNFDFFARNFDFLFQHLIK